jgi:hypothetical protein
LLAACPAAFRAPGGSIFKTLLKVKLLFTGSKSELFAAIPAYQNLVRKNHYQKLASL